MTIIGGRTHDIEMIHEVGKLGYPFAEISIYDPEKEIKLVDDYLKVREKYSISYLAHYPNEDNPLELKTLKDKFFPKMKKLFEVSKELQIEKGTIHFFIENRWMKPEVISEKIKMLSELVHYALRNGVTLCIENLTERYDSFQPAFEAIDELRMTMDIGHGELLSSKNTSFGFIEHVFNKIAHVHVHDNHGGKSVEDDLHLPLGEGIVNYASIFKKLKEKKYDSTITMELKPRHMPLTRNIILQHIV